MELEIFVLLTNALTITLALNNGLALKPPMGWMSGERYGCQVDCVNYPNDCISERLIMSTADMMVRRKFLEVGYNYVVVDDGWMDVNRDSNGRLQGDLRRFPSGIAALASYVHSKGLKLGLYLDLGNMTCCGYPGSIGNFQLDAQTLANWGVDMVKAGACGVFKNFQSLNTAYPALGEQLNATGRPILYLCEWPAVLSSVSIQVNYSQVMKTCNLYRTSQNIGDGWPSLQNELTFYASNSRAFYNYSGPGSFNDPDQLIVGDFGLSLDQQKLQMALWAIMSAPLFISADLRFIKSESVNILLNQLVIGIDQDPLGQLGSQISTMGQVFIWRKMIQPSGSFALAILYTEISGGPAHVSVSLTTLGLITAAEYSFTETLSGRFLGIYKPWYTLNCEVNPNGALLIEAIAMPTLKFVPNRVN